MAQWVMPTSGRITSTPGYRNPPKAGASSNHKGWDIAAPAGTSVYAASNGYVSNVAYQRGYGNVVYVNHPDGSQTRYAHLSGFNVNKGDTVQAGQRIGSMGSTGVSTGSHLHYERRDKNGNVTKPFGDDSLNSQMKKGANVKGGETGDGSNQAEDDGKKGDQEGNTDTDDANANRDKSDDPLSPEDKRDIKGSANNYTVTTTRSIVSRLPTHEPWPGHPKSTVGPRYGVTGGGGSNPQSNEPNGAYGGPGASSGGAMAQGNGTFDDYAPRIMDDLKRDFGFTTEQAAGIVGNLGHESGGFRQMQEVRPIAGRGGYGWAQWTGPRRNAFEKYASSNGLNINSYEANYGFLKHELMTTERGTVGAVKNTKTVEQAAYAFEQKFERAGIKHHESRYKWARRAKNLHDNKNGAADPETADPGMNKDSADQKPSSPSSATPNQSSAPTTPPTGASNLPMM